MRSRSNRYNKDAEKANQTPDLVLQINAFLQENGHLAPKSLSFLNMVRRPIQFLKLFRSMQIRRCCQVY